MKFIHCADIHLSSKMDHSFPKEIVTKRKDIIALEFLNLVRFAKNNCVRAILLSGDVFDSDSPTLKDQKWFKEIIKNNPDIDFIYLRGNHDINNSVQNMDLPNLKTFNDDQWSYFNYDNITIAGIELNDSNKSSLYSTLNLDKNRFNIVMLHGQLSLSNSGKDNINIKKLKDKNIDYLALGHVHKYLKGDIDDRGIYVNPGCLVSRGFDETSIHGYALLDIVDNKLNYEFIEVNKNNIIEYDLDITNCDNELEIYNKAKTELTFDIDDIYRLNLKGEINNDFEIDLPRLTKLFENDVTFISIKNYVQYKIDFSKYEKDLSLKGEFVRNVLKDNSLSNDDKSKIIDLGLKALDGKEINL